MSNKVKIGSFCKVRRGASPRPIDNPNYFGGNVGWIRISDVTKSFKYLNKTEQYVSSLGESLSVRVDKGDLVMSICGTIGRPIIINIPSCIHDGFVQLYEIQEADKEYLYYILQHHEKDLERKGQPGTQVNLNTTIVENFEVYFPTKPIQTKIAHILSTADAVIEKTQAAIDKYKAIKQGMLHDLFTRGIDLQTGKLHPRYEDAPELYKPSQLGWIPKEWEVKKLGDVGEVRMCRRVFNYETSDQGDIPFYKIGTFGKQPDAYISQKLYDSYRQQFSFPNKGDILISAAGTIGRTIIYDGTPSYFQDSNIVWIENYGELISNEYLYQVFQIVEYKTEGGTIQRLYNSILKSAVFPCPSKPEQKLITERLQAIDNKLQTEQTYLQKMQSLKKGLMEDLLSGRKCLNGNFDDLHDSLDAALSNQSLQSQQSNKS